MEAMLNCGIANGVEDSKYANSDYYENVWQKFTANMYDDVFLWLDIFWFPLLFIPYQFAGIGYITISAPFNSIPWIGWIHALIIAP